MQIDAKLLFFSRYNFTDEKTGEVLKGCKVTIMVNEEIKEDDRIGRKVYTENLPYEKFEELKKQKLPLDCKAKYSVATLDKKPKLVDLIY